MYNAFVGEIYRQEFPWKLRRRIRAMPITDHPCAANRSAVALPMPFDAPVTTMDLVMAILTIWVSRHGPQQRRAASRAALRRLRTSARRLACRRNRCQQTHGARSSRTARYRRWNARASGPSVFGEVLVQHAHVALGLAGVAVEGELRLFGC